MLYTFDGASRLIILPAGALALDVQDMYSRWKEWLVEGDNLKYAQALRVVGGDPTVGNNSIANYFFLMNEWRVRPQEASHVLAVTGTLLHDDGIDPFADTLGAWRVRIVQTIPLSAEVITVAGEGGAAGPTAGQIAAAVLNAPAASHNQPGSIGRILNQVLTVAKFLIYRND